MSKANIRDVSPFLKHFRNLLFGRVHNLAGRFEVDVATRSPPLPVLPDGPSHRYSANYYYSRDGRREVKPPTVIAPTPLQIPGEKPDATATSKRFTPGNVYHWD